MIAPNAMIGDIYIGAMPTAASYANLTQAILTTNRGQIVIVCRSQPFCVLR